MDREERWMRWGVMVGALLAGAVLVLVASGCISTPWYANPQKSVAKLIIDEKPDGTFHFEIVDDGDGTFARNFRYQGDGPEPWIMSLGAEHTISSPALVVTAQALDTALAGIPEIVGAIGARPAEPGAARNSWYENLFGLVAANPDLLLRLIGALGGGI